MDRMDLTCPQCGAVMEYSQAERLLRCPHCGQQMLVDDGRVQVDGDSFLEAGYRFEQGRIMARQEAEEQRRLQQEAAETAMRQEMQRRSAHNLACFWGSLMIMAISFFLAKELTWTCGVGVAVWAFADRRVRGSVRAWVICIALYCCLWRLIFG